MKLSEVLPEAAIRLDMDGRDKWQVRLHTLFVLEIPLDGLTDRVGHGEYFVRSESDGTVTRDAAQLIFDLTDRNPRTKPE